MHSIYQKITIILSLFLIIQNRLTNGSRMNSRLLNKRQISKLINENYNIWILDKYYQKKLYVDCNPGIHLTLASPDCKKFYFCANNVFNTITCPVGLLFNTITKKCDYEKNVVCISTTTPKLTSN